jgi:hypothetical protein
LLVLFALSRVDNQIVFIANVNLCKELKKAPLMSLAVQTSNNETAMHNLKWQQNCASNPFNAKIALKMT